MEKPILYSNFKPLNAGIILVDGQIATQWLEHNHGNRKLDSNLAHRYSKDMEAGNWTLTPDAIAFDEQGNLVNGQHRLTAIKRSGVAAPCVVIFDFPVNRSDFLNFDCGKNRTIRARIALSGHDVPTYAVDFAGAYLRVKYKMPNSSASARLAFIESNREIIEWACDTAGFSNQSHSRIPCSYMLALVDAKLCGCPDTAIQAFSRCYKFNDFEGMEDYNPKHVIELRDSRLSTKCNEDTVNVAKSRLNAFCQKLQKCYVRDNLYPAPLLPIYEDERALL